MFSVLHKRKKKLQKKTCFEYDWVENDLKHKKERHFAIFQNSWQSHSRTNQKEISTSDKITPTPLLFLKFFFSIWEVTQGMGKNVFSTKKANKKKECHLEKGKE